MALAVVTRPAVDQGTEDHDLVAAVRAGSDRAFELLYVRYQPRIAAYIGTMVHDHARVEDITQDVFMSALRRMRATEREIIFKPWMYEIAKNACIDAFRRSRAANEVSFDADDGICPDDHGRLAQPGPTPDSAVEGKVAIDNLCGAFGGLSQVHHDILVLREFEGLSYVEIGERLGMSRPAVESTLFRARKRLTEEYEELVSGERCVRVQAIVDASGDTGLRDRRRMARHLAHCQPCRRYARARGMDLDQVPRTGAAAAAARVAGFLPLPAFVRRRWGSGEEVAPLLARSEGSLMHWWTQAATVVDPGLASSWTKAAATAATVAIAGVGAGTALAPQSPSERSAAGGSLLDRGGPLRSAGVGGPGLEENLPLGWSVGVRVDRGTSVGRSGPSSSSPRPDSTAGEPLTRRAPLRPQPAAAEPAGGQLVPPGRSPAALADQAGRQLSSAPDVGAQPVELPAGSRDPQGTRDQSGGVLGIVTRPGTPAEQPATRETGPTPSVQSSLDGVEGNATAPGVDASAGSSGAPAAAVTQLDGLAPTVSVKLPSTTLRVSLG